MPKSVRIVLLAAVLWLDVQTGAFAQGLLDGRVFTGKIGPVENPDLDDTLNFQDGFFWSDICTRCGFLPGAYTSEVTSQGVRFQGVLFSESRGKFDYDGMVYDDGRIEVVIRWERKRWYWTSRREISFQGFEAEAVSPLTLDEARMKTDAMATDRDPLCARF